mgnify:CR=1 FL=1
MSSSSLPMGADAFDGSASAADQRRHMMDDVASFEQQQFDTSVHDESDAPACKIARNEQYGAHLIATAAIEPGDVIFKEKAFVAASWHDFHCFECMEPHKASQCERVRARYPKAFWANVAQLEESMTEERAVGEIDRARTLLRVLRMFADPDVAVTEPLQLLLSLDQGRQAPNFAQCLAAVQALRRRAVVRAAGAFPAALDDAAIARVLSILNRCSHELEDVGGSGLFLYASLVPHSCLPNCNFVTERDRIYVVAMRPIAAGDALTIDFSPAFYTPTAERQAALQRTQGFQCACPACSGTQPDRCRSFHCPRSVRAHLGLPEPEPAAGSNAPAAGLGSPLGLGAGAGKCDGGIVAPRGLGLQTEDWRCLACGYQLTEQEVAVCLDAERRHPAPPTEDAARAGDDNDDDDADAAGARDDDDGSDDDNDDDAFGKSPSAKTKASQKGPSAEDKVKALRAKASAAAAAASAAAAGAAGADPAALSPALSSPSKVREEADALGLATRYDTQGHAFRARTLAEIDAIVAERILTEAHHAVFHSLLNLGHELAQQASQGATDAAEAAALGFDLDDADDDVGGRKKGGKKPAGKKGKKAGSGGGGGRGEAAKERRRLCKQAEEVWLRVINAAEVGIAGPHPDKCNFLDYLAQVRVVARAIPAAQHAWQLALDMSCVVNGRDTRTTQSLRRLAKKPPATVEKMMMHYANMTTAMDAIEYEQDRKAADMVVKLMDASSLEEDRAAAAAAAAQGPAAAAAHAAQKQLENEQEQDDDDDDDGNDAVAFFGGAGSKRGAAGATTSLFKSQVNSLAGAAQSFITSNNVGAGGAGAAGTTGAWGAVGRPGAFGAPAAAAAAPAPAPAAAVAASAPAAATGFGMFVPPQGGAARNPFADIKR